MAAYDFNRPRIKTEFQRYECKYLIPECLSEEIRRYIQPYVAVDPHAANSVNNAYDIMSLYLDSPDLKLYWESKDGLLKRIKLRIRYYGTADGSVAFLEIKRRHNRRVMKGRARVAQEAVSHILEGRSPRTPDFNEKERRCYEEFVSWMARWLAQPTVWVKYNREAYVGTYNRDIRITMDRNLVCAPAVGRAGIRQASIWKRVETRKVVLELKFDKAYPDWLVCLAQRFRLEQRSYSKYGNCVQRGLDASLLSPIDSCCLPGSYGR